MQALSAVDVALWDLKAQLRDEPLTDLLGQARSDSADLRLRRLHHPRRRPARRTGRRLVRRRVHSDEDQDRAGLGFRHPPRSPTRPCSCANSPDTDVALMVDANGAYSSGQARRVGAALDDLGVVWFEEPVSSDDIDGLCVVKNAVRCDVAAGEYVSDLYDARHLLPAVDCLQLDATRCGGYTGWLAASAVAGVAQPRSVGSLRPGTACPGGRRRRQPAPHRILHRPLPTGTQVVRRATPSGQRDPRTQYHAGRPRNDPRRERRPIPP